MNSSELDNEIDRALAALAPAAVKTRPFDVKSYIKAFRDSARDKAQDVLRHLREDSHFVSKQPVFVSIGGGDGEEVDFLLQNSNGQMGVLIEMVGDLAELARRRTLPMGKILHVIPKSAQTAIGEAMDVAVKACRDGQGNAIVVTCHAILHELYDRGGQEFDVLVFFGRIFAHQDIPIWFTYREPGAPEKWPNVVLVSAACSPLKLLGLAEVMRARHRIFQELVPKPDLLGDGVRVHKNLGMEVLSKLFYLGDLPHEIEERSTAVDHGVLRNALWTAVGQKAVHEDRAQIRSYSAPTKSFVSKWEALKARVYGISDNQATYPLAIAESQTRVVAWRLPPQPSKPTTATMPHDMLVAQEALQESDDPLLESVLLSRGRSWIESPDRIAGIRLLEQVAEKSPPLSTRSLWSRYLLAIAGLFGGTLSGSELFEKYKEIRDRGLRCLFFAERMEFLRKGGNREGALEVANELVQDLASESSPGSDLERYALGTSNFLVSNFLRFGGRYDEAVKFIEAAEVFLKPSIPSHATELAHCFYARQVCVAMTGVASFSHPNTEAVQQFAAALIELSYSHAAWFIGQIEQAQKHAERAANRFEQIGTPGYARRARSVQDLLGIWQALANESSANYENLEDKLRRGVSALISGDDHEYLRDWIAGLRPSIAVGLLQLPKRFSKQFDRPVTIPLPRTLEVQQGNRWRWGPVMAAGSLRDANRLLRSQIGIPIERVIPLIAD